ncbi:MAG: hypothetical protein WBQ78_17555 [Gammaproteobacteria bacterium]
MQPSKAPHAELERAGEAIACMRSAASLDEFEEHWKDFLHRIERVLNKTKAHYGRSPKFGNWAAPVEEFRRKDPLLAYLCNARGAEEHTVNEITERKPGGVGIGLADGVGLQPDGSVLIERLEIRSNERGIHVRSKQPLKFEFEPARARMSRVVNRGRTYEVPTAHNGSSINPEDLPATAEAALNYYAEVVKKAEAFFVK